MRRLFRIVNGLVHVLALGVLLVLGHDAYSTLTADSTPPVVIHDVRVEMTRPGILTMTVDRTKQRQCPSHWVVQSVHLATNGFETLWEGPGTVGGPLGRDVLTFDYKLPPEMLPGDYRVDSGAIYTCEGREFKIDQPVVFFTLE